MSNKTVTLKCDTCGQELTFYKDRSDGCCCPICNPSVYRSVLKPLGENIRGKDDIKATRELYKNQSKKNTKPTIEDIFGSKCWF